MNNVVNKIKIIEKLRRQLFASDPPVSKFKDKKQILDISHSQFPPGESLSEVPEFPPHLKELSCFLTDRTRLNSLGTSYVKPYIGFDVREKLKTVNLDKLPAGAILHVPFSDKEKATIFEVLINQSSLESTIDLGHVSVGFVFTHLVFKSSPEICK
jgi:hypothetical protein